MVDRERSSTLGGGQAPFMNLVSVPHKGINTRNLYLEAKTQLLEVSRELEDERAQLALKRREFEKIMQSVIQEEAELSARLKEYNSSRSLLEKGKESGVSGPWTVEDIVHAHGLSQSGAVDSEEDEVLSKSTRKRKNNSNVDRSELTDEEDENKISDSEGSFNDELDFKQQLQHFVSSYHSLEDKANEVFQLWQDHMVRQVELDMVPEKDSNPQQPQLDVDDALFQEHLFFPDYTSDPVEISSASPRKSRKNKNQKGTFSATLMIQRSKYDNLFSKASPSKREKLEQLVKLRDEKLNFEKRRRDFLIRANDEKKVQEKELQMGRLSKKRRKQHSPLTSFTPEVSTRVRGRSSFRLGGQRGAESDDASEASEDISLLRAVSYGQLDDSSESKHLNAKNKLSSFEKSNTSGGSWKVKNPATISDSVQDSSLDTSSHEIILLKPPKKDEKEGLVRSLSADIGVISRARELVKELNISRPKIERERNLPVPIFLREHSHAGKSGSNSKWRPPPKGVDVLNMTMEEVSTYTERRPTDMKSFVADEHTGDIVSASLRDIMLRLTRMGFRTRTGADFAHAFFMSHPYFIDPISLLKLIILFYRSPPEEQSNVKVKYQDKVIQSFGVWLKLQHDILREDKGWVSLLERFMAYLEKGIEPNAIKNAAELKQVWADQAYISSISSAPLKTKITEKPPNLNFLDVDVVTMAKQLTLGEQEKFHAIPIREYYHTSWSGKRAESLAPNLLVLINRFNEISYWVATLIVDIQVNEKERASIITYWLRVMNALVEIKNYNSAFQIYTALNMTPIGRLKRAWKNVSKPDAEHLNSFTSLIENNFREYRIQLDVVLKNNTDGSVVPCMPLHSLVLRDLTMIEEMDDETEDTGDVHWEKMTLFTRALNNIKLLRKYKFDFKEESDVQQIIFHRRTLEEDNLYENVKQINDMALYQTKRKDSKSKGADDGIHAGGKSSANLDASTRGRRGSVKRGRSMEYDESPATPVKFSSSVRKRSGIFGSIRKNLGKGKFDSDYVGSGRSSSLPNVGPSPIQSSSDLPISTISERSETGAQSSEQDPIVSVKEEENTLGDAESGSDTTPKPISKKAHSAKDVVSIGEDSTKHMSDKKKKGSRDDKRRGTVEGDEKRKRKKEKEKEKSKEKVETAEKDETANTAAVKMEDKEKEGEKETEKGKGKETEKEKEEDIKDNSRVIRERGKDKEKGKGRDKDKDRKDKEKVKEKEGDEDIGEEKRGDVEECNEKGSSDKDKSQKGDEKGGEKKTKKDVKEKEKDKSREKKRETRKKKSDSTLKVGKRGSAGSNETKPSSPKKEKKEEKEKSKKSK